MLAGLSANGSLSLYFFIVPCGHCATLVSEIPKPETCSGAVGAGNVVQSSYSQFGTQPGIEPNAF